MSQSFRAVREIWNAHSSCFIEPEKLIVLLHDLAPRVGSASDEHGYGDNQVVWPENGRKVLDYMEAGERFSAASFKDSLEEQGIAVNKTDLIALIGNIQSLSKQWRNSRALIVTLLDDRWSSNAIEVRCLEQELVNSGMSGI
jgi:hypothetical protein